MAAGEVDRTFSAAVQNGLKGSVSTIVKQADGKIIVGGIFTRVDGFSTISAARLAGGTSNAPRPLYDFDGDGKADIAVYRAASTAGGQSYSYYRPSSQSGVDFRAIAWGTSGDKPVMGDFDGDGKLDAAVFRPSNGVWYILQSSNNQVIQQPFGLSTDIPTPADYDGDGKTNIAVFRPSTGFWYTSTNPQTNFGAVQFGAMGDLPVPADYDGDGRADIAVYRPSNGVWYLLRSTAGFLRVFSSEQPRINRFRTFISDNK